jgi:uncharacterized protein YprB with RNaseH-like and TPR domain
MRAAPTAFEVRRRAWPLDHVHAHLSLEAAVRLGRTAVGPAGERVAWLDTETTGLAGGTGTYVFLVGVGTIDDGEFVVSQYFLRDLGGEPEMLQALSERLREFDALVTFNGTRFDLPLLQTRFLLARLRVFDPAAHLDLITLARRLWYRRLGGYSLARLEQAVLKVDRVVDVAGWMIPSLYVQYLQTGDLDLLEPVFAHNAADLLSLLSLHGLTGELLMRPAEIRTAVDWYGLGTLLDARGDAEGAIACYRAALHEERTDPTTRRRVVTALARHYRRRGEIPALLELWDGEVQAGVLPRWQVLERLAMVWEWALHDPRQALRCAEQAGRHAPAGAPMRERLERRCDRLRRRLAAAPWGSAPVRPS